MTIEWTSTALLNLADILDRVTEESPQGAASLSAEIQSKTARIESNPNLYRAGRVRGTRECVVTENYLMVYRITPDAVQILNVLHTRQQWPKSK
ncbi:type II toxin-antitoxin system RelE/ParE family toxin [Burkholderia ubonensis]|uniref:Addiction module antitoxin n=1 Tax=Burkholderia ubonensis TaxID=101571 RepID=A0A1R1J816_9BURK|nr:type II toxin-antitoxin system RelE/ParE family toxin [Burkholderia ubonensis]OMG71389.1 addiction module antitoxin [Burkholderia ubonensis]